MIKWTGNKSEALDAVHDVILKWSSTPEKFEGKSPQHMQAMFMRALMNNITDKFRRKSKSCELKIKHQRTTRQSCMYDIEVMQEFIQKKFGWFTSEIFRLIFIDQHKVDELAKETNISRRTLYHERKKIKDELRRIR